jgi:hypothetical protein
MFIIHIELVGGGVGTPAGFRAFVKREQAEHTKPAAWYVSFSHGNYLCPEQCLLAWVFVNELLILVKTVSFINHCKHWMQNFDFLIDRPK